MPRFAANISTMFQDRPFLDRIDAARKAGFKAVECQFPYADAAMEIRRRLDAAGLEMVLINTPPGDLEAGERGLAALPGRQDDFRDALARALRYAEILGCRQIHVMAGILAGPARREAQLAVYRSNLRFAAEEAGRQGRRVLIEPLNDTDAPGYLIGRVDEALAVIEAVGHPNLYLQYDFYHTQMMSGNLATRFRAHQGRIGHVQIAGVPGRHEPDVGEINYPYLLEMLDECGYGGWVGCEYLPRGRTEDGLAWIRAHGVVPEGEAPG
jgi:2-dehydrotetronate isomerase